MLCQPKYATMERFVHTIFQSMFQTQRKITTTEKVVVILGMFSFCLAVAVLFATM
jgi:hypothetical protein